MAGTSPGHAAQDSSRPPACPEPEGMEGAQNLYFIQRKSSLENYLLLHHLVLSFFNDCSKICITKLTVLTVFKFSVVKCVHIFGQP